MLTEQFKQEIEMWKDLSRRTKEEYTSVCRNLERGTWKGSALLSVSRIKQIKGTLKALRAAQLIDEHETFGLNLALLYQRVKVRKKVENHLREKYVDDSLFSRLLDALPETRKGDELRRAFVFARYTGLREMEVVQLRPEHITEQGGIYLFQVENGKGGKARTTYANRASLREKHFDALSGFTGFSISRHYIASTVWHAVKTLPDVRFTFHDLRHTCCTWLLDSGVSIDVVKEMMGHESLETTMIYREKNRKLSDYHINMLKNIR